jgi:hypothetical protein
MTREKALKSSTSTSWLFTKQKLMAESLVTVPTTV